MKVRATVDVPKYNAAAFGAVGDLIGPAEDFRRQVQAALPAGDGTTLDSVEVADTLGALTEDTITPGTDSVAGGAAGAHVATGINADSILVAVWQVTNVATDAGPPTVADLTDEFTVSDDDEVDNTAGTDTTGSILIVSWVDRVAE